MYELKSISKRSLMRVLAVVCALLYVVFAVVAVFGGRGDVSFAGSLLSALVGVVLAAAFGAVLGVLIAAAYNIAAKKWGGVHLDFLLVHEDEHETHEDAHGGGTVAVDTKHQ